MYHVLHVLLCIFLFDESHLDVPLSEKGKQKLNTIGMIHLEDKVFFSLLLNP